MDHRIPLSRGGRHEIENITPACKPCNSRKHTRTEEEFRALLRREREGGVSEDDTPYVASGRGVPSGIDVGEQDVAVRRLDVHAA